MSDKDFSMWELSSGLPLDGARVHCTEATFTYNQEYSADAVVLDLTWQPWDGTDDDGEAKHQLYSVGKKWEPANEGASVQHESGKRQMFNNQTNIGKLIHSYLEARGDGDVAEGMKAVISEGGEPDQAEFWIGLDVTLKSIPYKTQNGKDASTFGVGEYHGRVGEQKAKGGSKGKLAEKPAGKPATAKPAAKAADVDGEDGWKEHLGMPLYLKLTKLAKGADDHDDFMSKAFDLDDVTSDDKSWNKVTEKIIMGYEDGSLFATARG